MNHDDGLWQEYAQTGEPISGVGHDQTKFQNHAKLCASSHVWFWRMTKDSDDTPPD